MFQAKIFPKNPKFSPGVPAVPAGFRDSEKLLVWWFNYCRLSTGWSLCWSLVCLAQPFAAVGVMVAGVVGVPLYPMTRQVCPPCVAVW